MFDRVDCHCQRCYSVETKTLITSAMKGSSAAAAAAAAADNVSDGWMTRQTDVIRL